MTINTTDRAAINRRNAQKSTGPRTPEGKNRSRFNAVKHGMTAKTLVLPDEDANVLQIRLESFMADLQPQNAVEQVLLEQAVHSSWLLDRASRAEVARLSHLIESVPIEEANRQQEVVSALGSWLLSDRDVAGDMAFRADLLNVLVPARPGPPDHRCLDIRNHPEAIVFRLESTAAGCRWLLDRWTELRALLDQGAPWLWDEKVKAIRLLGKRPLDLESSQWQDYLENRDDREDPNLEDLLEGQLDRQLDPRLANEETKPLAAFRSIADPAIARLETLAAAHRERAEAHAAQQSAILSFDVSNEGERLRRYQFACSRSLFRSLDTLIKVRRSGLAGPSEERTQESEAGRFLSEACSVVSVPCPVSAPVDEGKVQNEPTGPQVEDGNPHDEPIDPLVQHQNPQDEPTDPPVDDGNRPNEPTDPPVASISRPGLPFHRNVLFAMTLVVLVGAAAGSHRNPPNEPTAVTVDHRSPRNEATAAPCWVPGVDPPGRSCEAPSQPTSGQRPGLRGFEQSLIPPRDPTAQVHSAAQEKVLAGFPILSKSDRPQYGDETEFPSPHPTMRILIVDDEPNIRMTLRVALESMRHAVEVAAGIPDAVKWIGRSRFDLALVDLRLGNESGLELLETCLRRAPGWLW